MSSDNFKHALFAQFARLGKALGNGYRLEMLEFLAQCEYNVESLARLSDLSVANASQHLQQLRQAGLVTTRKEGLHVYYRLTDGEIIELMAVLRRVAERNLAEVDKLVNSYLKTKDELEPIPAEELLQRVRDGLVTVLDVRPPEEFAAGHVPGAVNIPLAELERLWPSFDADKEIVAYCRGPFCVLAYSAVEKLRSKGLRARRLADGYPEWKEAGLPISSA
ncbi:MAG: metalloregulator ArsR/SmtB family transcription factor [Planctomycetes bacterium]|nr:metalloregulator ArsR/SmtB family transcription factor [Planctomycetota bacterium]